MRTEGETGDGGYLRALADVHLAQLPDDRPREHHVYPGHRHRGMDCVPSYLRCHPAHQEGGNGYLILYILIYAIPGSEIQKGISGSGFLRLWGWMRAWLHGGSVMAFRVKNYEILGVFI